MTSNVSSRADAGERAGGDVAHGVAARFARGDADRRQPPHEGRRVFDVDEVELEVLARGDVRDAVGVLLGELGHDLELLGREPAERDLDPLHAGRVPDASAPLVGFRTVYASGRLSVPSWRWPLS